MSYPPPGTAIVVRVPYPNPHFIIRPHLSSPLTAGPRRVCMHWWDMPELYSSLPVVETCSPTCYPSIPPRLTNAGSCSRRIERLQAGRRCIFWLVDAPTVSFAASQNSHHRLPMQRGAWGKGRLTGYPISPNVASVTRPPPRHCQRVSMSAAEVHTRSRPLRSWPCPRSSRSGQSRPSSCPGPG